MFHQPPPQDDPWAAYAPYPPPAPPAPPQADSQIRTWAALTHLSGLAGYIVPFCNIVGPLVFWMLKRDESPELDRQGKEALNFQITMTIFWGIAIVASLILIGIPLLILLFFAHVILTVVATVNAAQGKPYHYPFGFEIVK